MSLPHNSTYANFEPSECLLLSASLEAQDLGDLLAQTSRSMRLQSEELSEQECNLASIVYRIGAPLLCSFVLGILFQARRDGCRRLYFLSRDGYIYQKIAEQMCARLGWDIHCEYLYASRLCWELAAIREIDHYAITHILQSRTKSALSEIALRVDLTTDQLKKLLKDPNFTEKCDLSPLNLGEMQRLRDELKDNQRLRNEIESNARSARRLTKQYLQERGVAGNDWGFVDVGWKGTLQKCYMRLFDDREVVPTSKGYYFGTLEKDVIPGMTKYGWLFEIGDASLLDTKLEVLTMIESFCSAPHGSLMRYYQDEETGETEAELRAAQTDDLNAFGMPFVRDCLIEYNTRLCDTLTEEAANCNIRERIKKLLIRFMEHPTKQEAQIWGAVPYEGIPIVGGYSTIASPIPLSTKALWESLRFGRAPSQKYFSWSSGSLRLTAPIVRVLIVILMQPAKLARKSRFWIQLSRSIQSRRKDHQL